MADQFPDRRISVTRMAQGGAVEEVVERAERTEERNAALFVAAEELWTLRRETGMVGAGGKPGEPDAPSITRMAQPAGAAKELQRVEDERRRLNEQVEAIAKRHGFTPKELLAAEGSFSAVLAQAQAERDAEWAAHTELSVEEVRDWCRRRGEILVRVIEEGKAITGWLQRPSGREIAYAEGRADAWFDLAEGLQEGDLNGAGLERVIEEGKRTKARPEGSFKRNREYKEGQAHVIAHLSSYLREGDLPEPRGPIWKTGGPELSPPGAGPGGYGSAAL